MSTQTDIAPIAPKRLGFGLGSSGAIWIATAALFAVSAVVAPGTVRPLAIGAMLPFAAILAIVAVGQTIVIQQRGIDLSCASLMGFSGLFAAHLGVATGFVPFAIAAALVVTGLFGALNGFLVARLAIMPIVATLATNSLFFGAMFTLSSNRPIYMPKSVENFSVNGIGGIPNMLILAVLFVIAVAFIMNKTVIGRRYVAVGANPDTARAAGIRVEFYQIGTYVAAALCFGVAGILYAGYIGSAQSDAGNPYLLPGIAAVIVGGTSFTGGKGSVVASGVAAIFMSQLDILVAALGARSSEQLLVQALAIILAASIGHMVGVWRKSRPRQPHPPSSLPLDNTQDKQ